MTLNVTVEMLGKKRRLFYDLGTGKVMGLASGGGALDELTGADLLVATFNDVDAPAKFGCLETYYSPIGRWKAATVDQGAVDAYKAAESLYKGLAVASGAGASAKAKEAFEALSIARNAAVTYEAVSDD